MFLCFCKKKKKKAHKKSAQKYSRGNVIHDLNQKKKIKEVLSEKG